MFRINESEKFIIPQISSVIYQVQDYEDTYCKVSL